MLIQQYNFIGTHKMSECKTDTQCSSNTMKSHSKKEGSCDIIKNMEKLANQAWEELFKEKVKKHYEHSIGKKMNENAKIVAEQIVNLWKNKMLAREPKRDYEYKLFPTMKEQ